MTKALQEAKEMLGKLEISRVSVTYGSTNLIDSLKNALNYEFECIYHIELKSRGTMGVAINPRDHIKLNLDDLQKKRVEFEVEPYTIFTYAGSEGGWINFDLKKKTVQQDTVDIEKMIPDFKEKYNWKIIP